MNRPFFRPVSLRRVVACIWVMLTGILISTTGRTAEPARRMFDIPAGPAESTLRRFTEQAGGQFMFSIDKVAGVRTNLIKGEFTPREALERLVHGTELRVVVDDRTGALTVERVPAAVVTSGNGAIEGRVFNELTSSFVNHARVMIEALRLETFTDESGRFHFPRVPSGEAAVRVFYTGFPAQTQIVNVAVGARVSADFTLRPPREGADDTVRLDAFTVATKRDMAASDVAVNEQRFSPTIKNVVATDSFADIADGNVGEFAKFLPGVTLNRSGSDGLNLSLGGVPPSGTPILVDGNSLASAASSNPNRTIEFENLSITSMSRVEVVRSQNPDSPANAIGGVVNLISKSAFERARPQYVAKGYFSFRGEDFSFSKQPGPFAGREYPYRPNVEFSAVVPVSRRFGFTATALMTETLNNGPGSTQDWVPTIAAQSTNFPATTPDRPYLVRYRVQERPKITKRQSGTLAFDWRVSDTDTLTVGMQYAYFYAEFWVRQLNFDVGRVASFGADFTQGADGAGFAQLVYDAREKNGTSYMPSLRYKHTGPVWEWQAGGAFSGATNHYQNKGYFQANGAFLRNVTIRFEQMGFEHPGVISVRDAAGRSVDPYQLGNYTLESVSGLKNGSSDVVRSAYAYVKRDLNLRMPVTVKAGLDLRSQRRDMVRPSYSISYVGADGAPRTADDNAAQWFDPVYSQKDLLFGPRMQWMDIGQIGQTFRTHPDYFRQAEADAISAYRSQVTTSQVITETITAPYVRLDSKLLDGRLQLTGGVRYERTTDDGQGPLIEPSRIYQRNASGQIVRDSAGRPLVVAPLTTLTGTKLAYIERGARTSEQYDHFFPSLNVSFLLRPNFMARASYSRSINRPDFGNILPSINLPDPETTARTITLTNPSLKPWIADSYGVALEYYFDEPSTGVVSARLYRRDISDFWGNATVPATDDLLDPWGLDPTVYGQALGYSITTTRNVGSARVSGAEFDYRQNLAFLPHWARGFTVFANLTLQHLEGSSQASFSGFVGKTTNYGITFNRARFAFRLAVNLRGRVKQDQVTNAGAEPGTFTYLLPRYSADLTAEYRLTKHVSLFATARNLNEEVDYTVTYGPSTPRDRSLRSRAGYGATWYVGVKGVF